MLVCILKLVFTLEFSFSERCSPYSSGHAFQKFIDLQSTIAFGLTCSVFLFFLLSCSIHRRTLRLNYYFEFCTVTVFLAVSCGCLQISTAWMCRPFEILFDFRFILNLVTQVTGFIGCLLFAYKLGATFALEIPIEIVQDEALLSSHLKDVL